MNTDPQQIESALFLYKAFTLGNAALTVIIGLATLYSIFRRQPPIDEVIKKLELRWAEQDTEQEKDLTIRLGSYQLKNDAEACERRHNAWTQDVEKRAIHMVKEAEDRSDAKFATLHTDMQGVTRTLGEVAKDVARIAGKVDQ